MGMSADKLAKALHDAQGAPGEPTSELKGMAAAIVAEVSTMSIVTFLPATINGVAPSSGGPLSNGSGSGGTILGPTGPTLAAQMVAKMGKGGTTPQMLGFATGVTTHLLTGKVSFSPGNITGVCTNSPTSGGTVTGAGSKGKIGGLSASAMAQLIVTGLGQTEVTDRVKKMCEAIVSHLTNDAEVSFTMGGVVGAASAGGGPIIAGAGTAGKVS